MAYRSMRERAEARLARLKPEQLEQVPEAARRLMHELSVHQVELEMQNEELRQTQASLEVLRTRYFDLFDQAPIGYLMLDASGRIRECNRTGVAMLGNPAALAGRLLSEFIVPTARHAFSECRDRLLSTGEPQQLELPLRRADGTTCWVQVVMNTTVAEPDGPAMRVTMGDITDRKRLEEETGRLAAVVTWSEQAIIRQELTGEISSWNPAAERLFGYEAERIVGSPMQILYPLERLADERTDRQRVSNGARFAYETVRMHRESRRIPVFVSVAPIFDQQGRITGISHMMRDIHEEIELRHEQALLLNHLRASEHALRQADRRKDEFIATLAHELRNPLAPIRNAAAVLRYGPALDPKQEWCRDVIDRQVAHMATLLDDLLDVSRVTRNMIRLHLDRVDLSLPITQAVEITRPLLDDRGHSLSVEMPSDPIEVHGDATRLTQVFGNLLNNAAKYTDRGGQIRLSVRLEGANVAISVRDTGIGIPPDQLPHVFELFSQVESGSDRGQAGLGIGLSLVKALVEKHQGTVTALSDGPGTGSQFVVRLPAVWTGSSHQRVASAPDRAASGESQQGDGHLVLIVDDNRDSVESMALMLTLHGFRIRTAEDGEAALEVARREHPDVAILDVGLPKLNGLDVGRRIREEPWGQTMLLIACTGWGQREDQERSRAAGFDFHMVKPVDLDALLKVLLSHASAGRSDAPDHP
jgi:PAS domain S-box-containing protein